MRYRTPDLTGVLEAPPTRGRLRVLQGQPCPRVRPCPTSECVHHLDSPTGWSCVLDVVDAHPDGLDGPRVGAIMGLTKQVTNHIETKALRKLRLLDRRACLGLRDGLALTRDQNDPTCFADADC